MNIEHRFDPGQVFTKVSFERLPQGDGIGSDSGDIQTEVPTDEDGARKMKAVGHDTNGV